MDPVVEQVFQIPHGGSFRSSSAKLLAPVFLSYGSHIWILETSYYPYTSSAIPQMLH
jgi:hypothetical protein